MIPEGRIALGKLAQALVHGARVLAVDGSFDDCLVLVRELAERHPVALVNSVNPLRIQGQKTVAFEITEALGDAPDVHCIPVGNAGNITATWLGYTEAGRHPRMLGFQARRAAPLVDGHPIERPATIASAIRISRPASAEGARRAVAESGRRLAAVTDRQILAAYRLLAREGVFVEMASAASVAGLLDAGLDRGLRVVCTVTDSGLKDPDWALAGAPEPTASPPTPRPPPPPRPGLTAGPCAGAGTAAAAHLVTRCSNRGTVKLPTTTPTRTATSGQELVVSLLTVARRLQARLPEGRIDPAQMFVLHHARPPGSSLRVSALAEAMGLDISTASRHVRQLEVGGHSAPRPDDRRAFQVRLTRRGRAALEQAMRAPGDAGGPRHRRTGPPTTRPP